MIELLEKSPFDLTTERRVLIIADWPTMAIDSITSGYNVPCARKST